MAASVIQPGSTWAEHRSRARLFWVVLLGGGGWWFFRSMKPVLGEAL